MSYTRFTSQIFAGLIINFHNGNGQDPGLMMMKVVVVNHHWFYLQSLLDRQSPIEGVKVLNHNWEQVVIIITWPIHEH